VCGLETSRMGAPYIYDISRLRVNHVANILSCLQLATQFLKYLLDVNVINTK